MIDLPLGVFLTAGLVLLVVGAYLLVRGASSLARALGISPLVVGLTVVALGTSSPEIAVGVASVLTGPGGSNVAVGNVVGSNIFNVLVVLGAAALVVPLRTRFDVIRLEIPLTVGLSVLVLVLGWNGLLSAWEGAMLLVIGVGYLWFVVQRARKGAEGTWLLVTEDGSSGASGAAETSHYLRSGGFVAGGLVLLVLGSDWMVQDALRMAERWGVSELVVGLTVVATGTSLPELASSLAAVRAGEQDIAVGNVVGSNIMNLLFVLGLTATVAPSALPVRPIALGVDLPVMIACAVAALPIFWTGYEIARWEGALFLGAYLIYVTYLWLRGLQHEELAEFQWILLFVVLPLTALALGISVYRHWRENRQAHVEESI